MATLSFCLLCSFVCAALANKIHSVSKSASELSAGVRIVDGSGTLSSVGLVQVRTELGFGSICGLNLGAADVLCKQLGFDFGSVSSSPCATYGGSNLCGASGSPIAMKDLVCTGHEWDIEECTWEAPTARCAEHELDTIVYCGNEGQSLQDGTLRLIDADGSPSIDGRGRLEMFKAGVWAPVCNNGFASGSVAVACRQMGFVGVATSTASSCISVEHACGEAPPHVSKLYCSGHEASVVECTFEEGDDVYCAPEESVLIRCSGDGETQGRVAKFAPPAKLLNTAHVASK